MMEPIFRISRMEIVLAIPVSEIYHTFWKRLAPSMVAAS